MTRLVFDVYGRFRVEVVRDGDRWRVYRLGEGVRREDRDVIVPADVDVDLLAEALEVELHELATPGRSLRRVPA